MALLSGNFIKSKEKKIEKAKQNLYNSLCEQFGSYQENTKKEVLFGKETKGIKLFGLQEEHSEGQEGRKDGFLKKREDVENTISLKFSSITQSLNEILLKMKPLLVIVAENENDLNKKNAARIMNYCAKRSLFTLEGNASEIIVERDFGKCMTIIHPLAKQLRVSDDEISSVLQEEIVFLTESISNKKHK